jgi:hypothetical protein
MEQKYRREQFAVGILDAVFTDQLGTLHRKPFRHGTDYEAFIEHYNKDDFDNLL